MLDVAALREVLGQKPPRGSRRPAGAFALWARSARLLAHHLRLDLDTILGGVAEAALGHRTAVRSCNKSSKPIPGIWCGIILPCGWHVILKRCTLHIQASRSACSRA